MTEEIQDVQSVLSRLEIQDSTTYYEYVDDYIPNELDQTIWKLIAQLIQADNPQRALILQQFGDRHSQMLFAFSERMASLGVREQSYHRLLQGLVALAIEGFRFDWRENLSRFSLYYDASIRIRADPEILFDQATSVS